MAETPIARATLLDGGEGAFENSTRTSLAPIALAPAAKKCASGHVRTPIGVICVGTRFVDVPLRPDLPNNKPAERTLEIVRRVAHRRNLVQPPDGAGGVYAARTAPECAFAPPLTRSPTASAWIDKENPTRIFWQTCISKPGDIILVDRGPPPFGAAALSLP